MKKIAITLLGLFFVTVLLARGGVFAEENVSADMASVGEMKATEASLISLPDGPISLDEELKDEEMVDADA